MVALNSDFAASKPDTDTKNRVGRFFSLAAETVGADSRSSRKGTGKKRVYHCETASVDTAFEYGPFGELIRATGEKKDDFSFRFSTKYEDTETGLLYYGYRYYNAETGRWLSRDPIAENGGINLYAYVENQPIILIDPDGRIGLVGAIYGGIAGGVGGYISSGGSLRGTLAGIGAGAAVGAINPWASGAVGGAVGAGLGSLAGQAAGNLVEGNDLLERCNYDFTAVAGAMVGGAIGGPLNSQLTRYVAPIIRNPIGRTLGSPGLVRTPGKITGAVVEGVKNQWFFYLIIFIFFAGYMISCLYIRKKYLSRLQNAGFFLER